ncbi:MULTISPECIES: NAD-dependent succinate-semialdehyde dehydrogenase [Proteus]|uniref:NAD-dependent succinate-semialdehyde dehydrogenase n=1 Tax=Proteus penneri TaxID=102862 RepID=A0ABS0W712_9GAMM|nr:NAD-dependent succinate-semialdehyde dehydrogenase [Proteus penneri]NBL76440.1 succinate-semialdehyde dehydrogenase [Proteus sp. G2672]NBL90515.1 succinate-semialdehyde dehydrogenase [Proteus sp. G2673]NBM57801.1 succinate-semialdehyde dehydrogenase [Proteus sp. G2667]NBM78717.1 succinate-semialdehyde dehydrogenase [Proteus sp. G2659]NBM92990.1 succinate-semialdehyde dehydrogenase [Proteus sp. G2662]NBN04769.1 succinate-semialdehyde dehydrogenase [Proteus sp. G2665]NBN24219.1 succinate-se
MKITANPYFREQGYIDGLWCNAKNNETVDVIDPATGTLLGTVPNMATQEAIMAVDAAQKALPKWRALTAHQRGALLQNWFKLIIENKRKLAELMTFEQGKPVAEAEGEITYAASFIEWFAEQGKRTNGEIIPSPSADKRLMVIKQGIGVCAAITPWNFPAAMITRKAAPALAAGCTMVIKPANETPYTALALAELAAQAGIPAGVINIVTGDAIKIGEVFTSDNRVRKLSFTGSTGVGRLLMRQCSDSVKKVSLELGGNAPFIVFNDADIDKAVEGAMGAKFRNAGQTCVCANRFYIHKDVYQQFSERFVDAVKKLKVGNGFEEGVSIGPLINRKAVEKSQSLLADTLKRGATLLCGGESDNAGENFFQPTVVGNVPTDSHILEEEIFGPVAPLVIFEHEDEVVHLANNTIYGLAAYFYSENPQRIWRVAENLEYGMVGINTGLISNEVAPFGGIKQSGLGREGSEHGIEDYMEMKYLCQGL